MDNQYMIIRENSPENLLAKFNREWEKVGCHKVEFLFQMVHVLLMSKQ